MKWRLVTPMLQVSLDWPFVIDCPFAISLTFICSCVLCILCCKFLWIVHLWLPLRYFSNVYLRICYFLARVGTIGRIGTAFYMQTVVLVKLPTSYKTLVHFIDILQSKPRMHHHAMISRWNIALGVKQQSFNTYSRNKVRAS